MSIMNEVLPNLGAFRDVQILVVDNDLDNRDSHAVLLQNYKEKVTTIGSIEDALDLLDWYIPAILICEAGVLGERIDALIQRVRDLAPSNGRAVPILVISSSSATSSTQDSPVEINVYSLNPVDLDPLVYEVWNLLLRSEPAHPLNGQDRITKQTVGLTLCSDLPEDSPLEVANSR